MFNRKLKRELNALKSKVRWLEDCKYRDSMHISRAFIKLEGKARQDHLDALLDALNLKIEKVPAEPAHYIVKGKDSESINS